TTRAVTPTGAGPVAPEPTSEPVPKSDPAPTAAPSTEPSAAASTEPSAAPSVAPPPASRFSPPVVTEVDDADALRHDEGYLFVESSADATVSVQGLPLGK